MALLDITSCSSLEVFGIINEEEEEQLDLPLGYRFSPNGQEIILHYLTKKILNQQLPSKIIKDIDLYAVDPHQLPISEFKNCKPGEGYFFTQLEIKDAKGHLKRTAKSGYWKATGKDVPIIWQKQVIGYKKIMIFYEGKAPNGTKTCWIMHEFRVDPLYLSAIALDNITAQSMVENCVVCKIHYKKESDIKHKKCSKAEKLPACKRTKAC